MINFRDKALPAAAVWLLFCGSLVQLVQTMMYQDNGDSAGADSAAAAAAYSPPAPIGVYVSTQASKFRVNVSNVCEKTQMRVTVRFNKPFYGLIHAKDRRKKAPCFVEGHGEQAYTLDISYTLNQTDHNYCGMSSHQLTSATSNSYQQRNQQQQQQHTLSLVLVVRLHKTIEFSDDRYFLLSCAKSDCSQVAGPLDAGGGNGNQPKEDESRSIKGLLTSDTIVSPTLREPMPSATKAATRIVEWQSAEKCDTVLDLKFQWLLKLCWILSILLILLLCLAFYFCFTFKFTSRSNGRRKINGSKAQLARQQQQSHSQDPSNNKGNFLWHPPTQLNVEGAAGGHSAAATAAAASTGEMRDSDNSTYQQQQFLFANLFSRQSQHHQSSIDAARKLNQLEPTQFIAAAAAEDDNGYHQQQQQQQPSSAAILGRAHESSFDGRRYLGSRFVKRRQSIGSSAAAAILVPEVKHKSSAAESAAAATTTGFCFNQTVAPQRLIKSKSQTTIHYPQSQDPFKTIPFSYLNSGYLSDGAACQSARLANPQEDYNSALDDTLSLPADQRWSQAIVNQQMRHQLDLNNNGMINQQQGSQFDPHNSSKLIDLIHHKHRQQIEQANMTAASLAPVRMQHQQNSRGWN